jgi:hypothetical protein
MTHPTHLTTPESLRRTANNLRRNAHESLIQADEIDALADAIDAGGARDPRAGGKPRTMRKIEE